MQLAQHGHDVFARKGASTSERSLNIYTYVDVRIETEPFGEQHLLLFRVPIGRRVAKHKIAVRRLPPQPGAVSYTHLTLPTILLV